MSVSHYPLTEKAMALAAFTLPALALTMPSGYSFAALLLCGLGALAWAHGVSVSAEQHALRWLAWAIAALCVVWAWDAVQTQPFKVNALDRPVKFALIWLALPAVIRTPPPTTALRWGVWLGAIGAAATAFWQVQVMGMDRAWGHTNAIQFGNLALLLGIWSAVWAPHASPRLAWLAWASALGGLYATLASASRGGWWVALVLCPMAWVLIRHDKLSSAAVHTSFQSTAWVKWVWSLILLLILGAASTQAPRLAEHTQQAWHEVQLHLNTGESSNSVGQRLAHWQLAWDMGWHHPLTGWGEQGYQLEKARRVDAGQAPAVLRSFQHAHNEWLDMWAKHGLLGLLVLGAVYAVPGFIYARYWWQGSRRGTPHAPRSDPRLACAVCGLMLVAGYLGFGMTQVMFAHNSSSLVYVFMNLLWMGAMLAPRRTNSPTSTPDQVTGVA